MDLTPHFRNAGRAVAVFLFCFFLAGAGTMPDSMKAGPAARLAAARAAPCSTAVKIFQELAADSTAPDSVRMAAAGNRADIAFALREYETARDYYKKASLFEKGQGRFHSRTATVAFANGDTAELIGLLSAIIDSGETPFRQEAAVQKAELLIGRKDFQGAMDLFRTTGPFSFKNSWSLRAMLGKLECARRLGLADSAAAYDSRLSGYRQTILEKERLRMIRGIPLAKTQRDGSDSVTPSATAADTAAPDSVFTLQVGAFGSKANAETLIRKLKLKHKEVSCVPAVVEERTFYRVWVGNFDTREAAERFGRDKLMREGCVYHVVAR
jgi:hypothetical protein